MAKIYPLQCPPVHQGDSERYALCPRYWLDFGLWKRPWSGAKAGLRGNPTLEHLPNATGTHHQSSVGSSPVTMVG